MRQLFETAELRCGSEFAIDESMRRTVVFLSSFSVLFASSCDPNAPEASDGPTGGKADDATSERARSYSGRDFYDVDRFDEDNTGRYCGFERARRGAITPGTRTISLGSVTFPLKTVLATDDREIRLERQDSDRSLYELPIFVGNVSDNPDDFKITVFIDRLTLEPDIMLISHARGTVQLCQGLQPEDG